MGRAGLELSLLRWSKRRKRRRKRSGSGSGNRSGNRSGSTSTIGDKPTRGNVLQSRLKCVGNELVK